MEKIYSRKRIKLPKLIDAKNVKRDRKLGKKVFFFIFIIILILDMVYFIYASYPIFKASCETAAASKAINIVTDEVQNVMLDYTYTDLIYVEKDNNGNVTFMQANTVLINKIISKIVSNIQKRLDNSSTVTVFINYGSISGITVFKNIGPKFEIELESAGKTKTNLKSEFESVNINQSIHRLYLDIITYFGILTPIGSFGYNVNSKVLLTEAVIVGDIPATYYNLEGIRKNDAVNLIE